MAQNGNREVLQSNIRRFRAWRRAFCIGSFDPKVEWIEPDGSPYRGTYRGPEEVLNGVFMRLGTEWDGFQVAPDELVGDGGSIVALGHLSGTYKATGKSFLAPFAHAWKFRDGRVVSFIEYTDTLPMQQALR